ncbi:type II toxin-antitoxin system VapC family toxin [Stakelama tenebrarum]|uniref:Ribonuclease VapC n=1 Tax=Stakelama tenebrarum TaxID=2711215 RepID=A0A6G6Y5T5_9SPHN|nr:type II toxin-antitoxin system VapC family toxin [Sphingosinithalassobacter tenebrarum]QIG80270.1 type II toxin-antitoxin system VapC family toxin [Sphingosinithalassobacter tenebrarum]
MTAPRYLIDTNIAIRLMRGGSSRIEHRIASLGQGAVALSAISHAELMQGIGRHGAEAVTRLEGLLETIPVLPFDDTAARALPRAQKAKGRMDRMIAAHALTLDCCLVTANTRDFRDVPGLRIEDWTI